MADNTIDGGATLSPDDGWNVIEPTSLGNGGSDSGGGGTRKRGRPAGSRNKDTEAGASVAGTLDLTAILLSIHTFAAVRFKAPSIELTEAEAKKIQKAIRLVEKHHKVSMSQKHADYAMAAWMMLEIYGPRVVSVYADKKAGRQQAETTRVEAMDNPTIMPFLRPMNQ